MSLDSPRECGERGTGRKIDGGIESVEGHNIGMGAGALGRFRAAIAERTVGIIELLRSGGHMHGRPFAQRRDCGGDIQDTPVEPVPGDRVGINDSKGEKPCCGRRIGPGEGERDILPASHPFVGIL